MNQEESKITDWLVSKGIYPFSVLYIRKFNILHISFFLHSEIDEILKILDYDHVCDNSGVYIYPETNTVIFTDLFLKNFLKNVFTD